MKTVHDLWLANENWKKTVEQWKGALSAAGALEGDTVAICLPTDLSFAAILMAAMECGLTAVPLNSRLPWRGIEVQTEELGCTFLIHKEIGGPSIQRRSQIKSPPAFPDHPGIALFTSGTSGKPKVAWHPLENFIKSAEAANSNIPLHEEDCWLLSIPLYHVGGLGIFFRAMIAHAHMGVIPEGKGIFDCLTPLKITHLSLVTTQLSRLLQGDHDMGSLKAVLLGGSAFSTALLAEAYQRELPIHTSFGMTESCAQVSCTPQNATWRDLLTAGKPLGHVEIGIMDGEICLRGGSLFKGYWMEGRLFPAEDSQGWFKTGDRGRMDEEGNLLHLGRLDNLFISGGENIHPEEIEAHLLQLEGISRAIVVPKNDLEFGYRPAAFLEQFREDEWDLAKVRERLGELLPRYKLPTAIYSWPSDLETHTLKISRKTLREIAENSSA